MKLSTFPAIFCGIFITCTHAVELSMTMNPVIGDTALEACKIDADANLMSHVDKVRCHLSYALDQLQHREENNGTLYSNYVLAQDDNEHENPITRRNKLLKALETYIKEGNFPQHEDNEVYRQNPNARKPNFVDSRTGTPCAVAYMMQQSDSDKKDLLVKQILESHKHDTIDEMLHSTNDGLKQSIESWASYNGLKESELALIQPTYDHWSFKMIDEDTEEAIKQIQEYYNVAPELRGYTKECTIKTPFLDENGTPTSIIPGTYHTHKVNDEKALSILEAIVTDRLERMDTRTEKEKEDAIKEEIKKIQDAYNIEPERRCTKKCTIYEPFLDENGKPTAYIPNQFYSAYTVSEEETEEEVRSFIDEILKKWNCTRGTYKLWKYFVFTATKASDAKGAADELKEKDYVDYVMQDYYDDDD